MIKIPRIIQLMVLMAFLQPASAQQQKRKSKQDIHTTTHRKNTIQYGMASYYGKKFQGKKTASGEIYDFHQYTAACNVLPLGTWIKVTNLLNKRSVIVRINDRMARGNKRIVDLSKRAAQALGFVSAGIVKVKIERLKHHPTVK